ncbi:DNA-binding NarL/FixJ family response regulator [Croceifilum oryzae]|uniref:DNA-binding NarL/FixJ family response regulator n=1 Tax=Croceifilum oryzae TaxID=1553429 RepID=A0AAJ1WRK3_9BACL|nr:helix-turn-helix transcriptional regulator [Croceifilum oryzae]MDQ0416083.1 DNA-binding NarL/FixJ family response regulator [Croceifilum oryzae]
MNISVSLKEKIHSTIISFGLTEREKEITVLWIAGYNYKEIALRVGVSNNTVRKHIQNIHSKLGVHSKTNALIKIMSEVYSGTQNPDSFL